MELISHQMQKLHLMEEERSPSPPRTNPTEILSLKVIRNHPYHHHLHKRGKTTQGSTSPTWGQIKCLVDMAKNAVKGWEQKETPAVLLAMITIISQQSELERPQGDSSDKTQQCIYF
jgi:hypothetical protein